MSPEEIVTKSVGNYFRSYREALNYTYLQRDEEKSGGELRVVNSQVIPIDGTPFEYTITRNGKQLTREKDRKEDGRIEKRHNESPSERAKRIREYQDSRAFLKEVPQAYLFKLVGEEEIDGREAYKIDCTPKPGYQPQSKRTEMLSRIKATLWIDKQDLQWARADATVIDTISIGWILARVGPGASMKFRQKRINDQVWLPSLIEVTGNARVFLVKDHPINERIAYTDFKRVNPQEAADMLSKLEISTP